MKTFEFIKKRPYILFVMFTIILGLVNHSKNIEKLSDLALESLKGIPFAVILIEIQKKRYIKIMGYIIISLALFSNIFIFVLDSIISLKF